LSLQSGGAGFAKVKSFFALIARERVLMVAALALAALAGAMLLWDPLDVDERGHVHRITRHAAEGARADLEAEMRALYGSLSLVATSWEASGPPTRADWESQARTMLAGHPGAVLVSWSDPRQQESRWSARLPGASGVPAADLAALEATTASPAASTGLRVLASGIPWLHIVSRGRGERAGSPRLVAVFDLHRTLSEMLSDHRALGYEVSVWEADRLLYRTAAQAPDEQGWGEDSIVQIPSGSWRVRVWPGKALLGEMRSSLPELALVVGGLLGVLLMLSIRTARTAQSRSLELKAARELVERRVQERTVELARVNATLRSEVQERTQAELALQKLSARLLRLQDEERRRLARELHDSTVQTLATVAVGLDRTRQAVRGGLLTEGGTQLDECAQLVVQATEELRTLSLLLHPPVLDDLGLEYALPWFAAGFSKRSGIAVAVDVPHEMGRLPDEVELTLYRIVQEGLANVRRHSGSPSASISLSLRPEAVTLLIEDEGRGIDPPPERGQDAAASLGVGLPGMRERVRQLRGELDVVSGSGGTRVRVVLPIGEAPVRSEHDSVGTAA
jgi:signal transduction histidine kinase